MGKNKKKEKSKKKNAGVEPPAAELEVELRRLTDENERLRARLERIAELAQTPLARPNHVSDVEDDEYDEMSRDVDDEIADARQQSDGAGHG